MASGSALSLIIVFCMAQLWGIDWVAAGSGWQAERMTIRLIPVSAERIPAWLGPFPGRLTELAAGGNRNLIFVRAASRRPYRDVIRAVDLAKEPVSGLLATCRSKSGQPNGSRLSCGADPGRRQID